MTQYLILCRSLTAAQSGMHLLERSGISCSVTKAPQGLSPAGCSYGISLYRRPEQAMNLLRQHGVKIGKMFRREPGEEYQEV